MPYTPYTTDERNVLQAMEGMALPKCFISVILGKHVSRIYRELFVDWKTKLLLANIIPDKSAATLNKTAVRAFKPIPDQMRNTLTVDNGKEFAAHKSLSQAFEMDIYFAHPYTHGRGGLNEHTNGLIRQYLPKKTPFDKLTKKHLDKIVDKINNRPGKVLGYLTSYEVFSL
jgi:IS30 family transposase